MIINEVYLYNFRNFKRAKTKLQEGLNLIIGENGSGKTSFLEALNFLYTGVSLKDKYDKILNKDENFGGAKGIIRDGVREIEKIIYLTEDKIQREVNGKKVYKLNEFKSHNTILFEPYDTMIIDGSPNKRRKFLDSILVEVSPLYEKSLEDYYKLLKLRNDHLKFSKNPDIFLDSIDSHFIELNSYILSERERFLDLLLKRTLRHLEEIEGKWDIDMSIMRTFDPNNITKKRNESLNNDKRNKHTTWGIHHDDIDIRFNSLEAKSSASRGQKRAMVISMKLANLDIFEKLSNKENILLLDDLLYELDPIRQMRLLKKIENYTAFLTSTVRIEAENTIYIKDNILRN